MAIRYLYEFDYNSAPTQRLVEGETIQTNTYTYTGVSSIEQLEHYLNITDTTSNFPTFIMNRAIDKFVVTRHKYNTDNEEIEETTRNLYSNVNVDSTTVVAYNATDWVDA